MNLIKTIKYISFCYTLFLIASPWSVYGQKQKKQEITSLFLTWTEDPTSTMMIDYHTSENSPQKSVIQVRELGDSKWRESRGSSFQFPYADRKIHRIKLNSLKPGTTYEFSIANKKKIYRFRTMPENTETPIRFAIGGDTMHEKDYMNKTNKKALSYDPDFIVWGGDLAYANGDPKNVKKWFKWFESIQETLIDDEGRVIPILCGIGNHEVKGGYISSYPDYEQTDEFRKKMAPFYYSFFEFPGQPGYNVMDFGNYLSIIFLDTEHTNPIKGAQSQWLEKTLQERTNVSNVFPVYHVPAYPSVREYQGTVHEDIRINFVPLFEKYGIKVAFENHDHAYKRTHSIKNGEIVEKGDGIVYLGDGCWGTNVRPARADWYLAKTQSVRHFIIVTLEKEKRSFLMVDENGNVIDEYDLNP
jgi:acid phosphatase type 7